MRAQVDRLFSGCASANAGAETGLKHTVAVPAACSKPIVIARVSAAFDDRPYRHPATDADMHDAIKQTVTQAAAEADATQKEKRTCQQADPAAEATALRSFVTVTLSIQPDDAEAVSVLMHGSLQQQRVSANA